MGSDVLLKAVGRVGEPDRTIRVDHNIVDGIEPASVIIAEDCPGLVGRSRLHEDESTWIGKSSLCAEQNTVLVIDASVAHQHVSLDLDTFPAAGLFLELGELDLFFPVDLELVAGDEHLASGLDVDTSLVSKGVLVIPQNALQLRLGPNNIAKFLTDDDEASFYQSVSRRAKLEDWWLALRNLLASEYLFSTLGETVLESLSRYITHLTILR